MAKKTPNGGDSDGRWVRKKTVWHVRAKRWIVRADGKDFVFRVGKK